MASRYIRPFGGSHGDGRGPAPPVDGYLHDPDYATVEDPTTHITTQTRVVTAEGVPCRLSYETVSASAEPEPASAVVQSVKVFLAPDMLVPAGSRLTITRPRQ